MNNKTGGKNLAFWSWNEDIEPNEVAIQIEKLSDKGIEGFFIHARAGLQIEYMGTDWFKACKAAIQKADELHMEVWLYDEYGWPSGFAGGKIQSINKDYYYKTLSHEKLKPENFPSTVVGVFDSRFKYIENPVSGNIYTVFYYQEDSFYVDLLMEDVVTEFIDATHEKYKKEFGSYFGNVIKGVFTDEPQMNRSGLMWSFAFEKEYEKVYHRELKKDLAYLIYDIDGYQKIRLDYFTLSLNRFKENFTKRIYDWCETNNLLFTGHFASEDSLIEQCYSNGGVMSHYEYMHLIGIDHLGKRLTPVILGKQASSVAQQLGRRYVLSETFGCSGWNVSLAELGWIWGWQRSLGINTPTLHLSPYSIKGIRKRDYPCFFFTQNNWWDKTKILSDYLNVMNDIGEQGHEIPEVAMLSALSSMWCEFTPDITDKMLSISSSYRSLAENLNDLQVAFHIIDEEIMAKYGRVDGSRLTIGKCTYQYFLLPKTINLKQSTFELLQSYKNNNGILIFTDEAPTLIDGIPQPGKLKRIIDGSIICKNQRKDLDRVFKYVGILRRTAVYNNNNYEIIKNISINTLFNGDESFTVIHHNSTESTQKGNFVIQGYQQIQKFEPNNGRYVEAETTVANGRTSMEVCLHPFETMLIKSKVKTAATPGIKADVKSIAGKLRPSQEIMINKNWRVSLQSRNSLLIDRGSYSFGDLPFSETDYIIRFQDKIYNELQNSNSTSHLRLKYTFNYLLNEKIPLELFIEDEHVQKIEINGRLLNSNNTFFKDTCFTGYLLNELQQGTNEIILFYQIEPFEHFTRLDGIFETERNKFSYSVDFESIYLQGDFDVLAEDVIDKKSHYSTGDKFLLVDRTEKTLDMDITPQNLWFYNGNMKAFNTIWLHQHKKYRLKVCCDCAVVNVKINGFPAGDIAFSPYEIDISDYVREGANEIELLFFGTDRNLFGPHHHMKGEVSFVGPSTYKGKKGFEDAFNPEIREDNTFLKRYSFVGFGLHESVKIICFD